jgi:hypothetical protein
MANATRYVGYTMSITQDQRAAAGWRRCSAVEASITNGARSTQVERVKAKLSACGVV